METSDILNAISEQRNAALNQLAMAQAQVVASARKIKELEDKYNALKNGLPAAEDGA
jgi:sensor histidine kinase regulating citrate/malate metabolism